MNETDNQRQNFGGMWTVKKLSILEKYLKAYSRIMNNQHFRYAYIDAFAGTGYFKIKGNETSGLFIDKSVTNFYQGSAKIALSIEPPFNCYIFIEKNKIRCEDLHTLRDEYPDKKNKIFIINDDANDYLVNLCQKTDWKSRRAVVFLDPFGMQIKWSTLEAIASTKAIDLWFLFPLGIAVCRLLKKNGDISESHRKLLNELFGTDKWYDAFYEEVILHPLFERREKK